MTRGSTAVIATAIVSALLVCGVHSTSAQPRGNDAYKVVRVQIDNRSQLDTLLRLTATGSGFEVWSDAVGLGSVDVRVSPAAEEILDVSGLAYDVSIADLQHYYDGLFTKRLPDVETDFFDAYRTYAEYVTFMEELAASYPDLAQMVDLGPSVEGRALWAVRISGAGLYKPGVLFHGGQHGNELTGPPVVAYMARHLLSGYDRDRRVRKVVDDVEWFLLPIMNPDGYVDGRRRNAHNVDLNRNWDGPGAGSNPFSEPETAAVRDFLLTHPNIRAHVDFHTYGNMIMWPWGYTRVRCQDHDTFSLLGNAIRVRVADVRGTQYGRIGPVYTTIYPIHGASVDYAYSELGIWSFTVELGCCWYAAPVSEILPTALEMVPLMMSLAEWVSDCNGNGVPDQTEFYIGTMEDCDGNLTADECEVQSDFDGDTRVDVCDEDIDNDGVVNESDACDLTPLGLIVDAQGRPVGDANGNCDIEILDHKRFVECLEQGGPNASQPSSVCLTAFDYDQSGRIDLSDFAHLATAYTGFR